MDIAVGQIELSMTGARVGSMLLACADEFIEALFY